MTGATLARLCAHKKFTTLESFGGGPMDDHDTAAARCECGEYVMVTIWATGHPLDCVETRPMTIGERARYAKWTP